MSDKKYETMTTDYIPGRKRGPGSQTKFNTLLAEGWEIVSEKHRFGAPTIVTLRRAAQDGPKVPPPTFSGSWAQAKENWKNPFASLKPVKRVDSVEPVALPIEPAAEPAVSLPAPSGPPAGWYVDPESGEGQRWWDGSAWSEHRQA